MAIKIVISYNCDEDRKIIGLISKQIMRSLRKININLKAEVQVIRCHRKQSNTIFIQPVHDVMDFETSRCYSELLKIYMKANECKCLVNKFLSRVKLGSIKIQTSNGNMK